MKYCSTRSEKITATAPEAILRGIAPDGGLYTPSDFSRMHVDLKDMLGKSAIEISTSVIGRILSDFEPEEMKALIEGAYAGKFDTPELTPVEKVGDRFVLELYHGPTSAFKDVALSVLPKLISASREKLGVSEEIMILTATSGDTGKAALEGFHDVEGTRILVFYPDGGVSAVQKAQMVTQKGNNVGVCAVSGNFDDAQTGVKRIFLDDGEHHWAEASGAILSSANSINLGRLAPQVAYYFKSYLDLVLMGEVVFGDPINFVVPTGNFGDILAGEFARRMGLPIAKLICASNANDVLTEFLTTGRYDRSRPFYKTISPSMDILVSSNLERCLWMMSDHNFDLVRGLMEQLKTEGAYQVPDALLEKMKRLFAAYSADDGEAMETIRDVWTEEEYLIDPHTAVAWRALDKYRADTDDQRPAVVLSTASPYKFPEAVLRAITGEAPEDGFAAMEELHRLTGEPVPANLAALKTLMPRFDDCVAPGDMLAYVQKAVRK